MAPGKPTMGELTVVTFGVPKVLFQCKTLELPWLNNRNRVSCIPVGEYTALFLPTEKFPRLHETEPWYKDHLWELTDVPDRSEVKFHHGNKMEDTLGCPLVGMQATIDAISQSREALRRLHLSLEAFENTAITVRVSYLPRK